VVLLVAVLVLGCCKKKSEHQQRKTPARNMSGKPAKPLGIAAAPKSSSSSSATANKNNARGPTMAHKEEDLLNDIEASTRRLHQQSRFLNDESKTHIHLLNKVEAGMNAETLALRAEAVRAETMRQGQSGVWWMYWVIAGEALFFVVLVYIGISNQ